MRLRRKPWIDEAIQAFGDFLFLTPPEGIAGRWRSLFPHPEHPLHVEIGTGKGQFIARMAAMHPEINYIGIEREAGVLYYAGKKVAESDPHLSNVRLLLIDAEELSALFALGEVDCFYLNFSDPWPKKRHYKRRLTYRGYLAQYAKLLKQDGEVRFKTDNTGLFAFSIDEFSDMHWRFLNVTFDLHAHPVEGDAQTEYEEKFSRKGNHICRLAAMIPETENG